MGNKQTVTTNEHKAELEFFKQENGIRYYIVNKVAYKGLYETFAKEKDKTTILVGFKETTTPGLWKFTEIKLDIPDYLVHLYKLYSLDGRYADIVDENNEFCDNLRKKLSSILKVGEETLTLS